MRYRIRKYSPIWWAKKIGECTLWGICVGSIMVMLAYGYVEYGGF